MRIGITCDLKPDSLFLPPGCPDDFLEEFDAPATVEAIAAALRGPGHQVEILGDGPDLLRRLLDDPPDFVFNTAEGQGVGRCREARVPAVLEMLGIPYTGSDSLTLSVTLDKDCAKRLVSSAGVKVPKGIVVRPEALQIANCKLQIANSMDNLQFPVIVKPAWEGSSKGIRDATCLADTEQAAVAVAASLIAAHRQPVLIEEFIEGDEITVGVLGNERPEVLGVMRVFPIQPGGDKRFIYSLDVKRDWHHRVRYECPPPYTPSALAMIEGATLEAYRALGCRDVARIDFRFNDNGIYFLEANPLPGLSPESGDLVLVARARGWDHARLVVSIFEAALDRAAACGLASVLSRKRPGAAPH